MTTETRMPDLPNEWVTLSVAEHTEDVFRPIGRTEERNGSLACDLTCTGIEFLASCQGDITAKLTVEGDCYFTVYINGERQNRRLHAAAGKNTITLAEDLAAGNYTVRLLKQSQFPMARVLLHSIKICGAFGSRPEERPYFIEFYGDSIVNGSNILLGGTSPFTSDGTRAFGFLTAETLNADCNIIGCGGMGLKKGSAKWVMGQLWNLNGMPGIAGTYDFVRRPDAVVIELGVNDEGGDPTVYRAEVERFLLDLRDKYGDDVPIVWVWGYHPNAFWAQTKAVLEKMGGEAAGYYACKLTESNIPTYKGGDGNHPNIETSKVMADELSTYLAGLLPMQK